MKCNLLLAGALLLVPGLAAAVDVKTAPGSICSPSSPSTDSFDVSIFGIYALANGVGVECPIVRDNSTNVMNSVAVRVFYGGSGSGVRCAVCSGSINPLSQPTGTGYECLPFQTHSTNGYDSLAFNTTTIAEWDDGTYAVTCNLDTDDAVMSIKWNEP